MLGHDDVGEELEAVLVAGAFDAVGDEAPCVELLDQGAALVTGEGEEAGVAGDIVADSAALCWVD